MAFGRSHCSYLVAGQIEDCSYVKNVDSWVKGDATTPHVHFYFETKTLCRWTKF